MLKKLIGKMLLVLGIKPEMPIVKLLWPQYDQDARMYRKEISQATFDELQVTAEYMLGNMLAADKITSHWKSIVSGRAPFGLIIKKGRENVKS